MSAEVGGVTLDELARDGHGVVTALDSRGSERRRLMDMGLLPGAEVHVDMTSPLGDPTAYLVRGSLIVLRRSQARAIHVEVADGEVADVDIPER